MIYLLSKVLPLALLPLGLSLLLLFLGLIGRWRWPVITAVVLLWIFSLGLVSQNLWRWLEAPWQRRPAAAASSAEAIVVLSGGRHPAPVPAGSAAGRRSLPVRGGDVGSAAGCTGQYAARGQHR